MSESVDTRVVEAKFDSEQFEKGVDKTVKKLDELKKSLNLKDAGDSIAELADKTQKASTKASESLEKLETRFTSFAGMLKQKFLSGIADEIVGVFFRIKSSFEGLVHSLSSAQVSYGMQRYNDILTSVRTLVSAGETQDSSYKVIERLGEYADQTSYSLDALVSTMSKFKTSGASLSTAQKMVEGLSNAAASMGVNAQDAQRAYLNLQQAYSKGAMLQNDWISFESIPMVGTKFNQRILEAAVAVGTLEEDKKNGGYKTKKGKKGEANNEVKTKGADATGITAENLGTKLSSRWFNKAVMEKVFGEMYFFSIVDVDKVNKIKEVEREYKGQLDKNIITQEQYNQKMDEYFEKLKTDEINEKQEELNELLKSNEITQEEYNKELKEFTDGLHIDQFSWEAFRAGQEARSLTDVLNTLKDTISRGWAKSFEYLFGKLDEAADLFTKMTESNIAEAIYAIGEFRNAVLEKWNLSGGRDDMLRFMGALDNTIGSVLKKIGLLPYSAEDIFNQRFSREQYAEYEKNEGWQSAELYKSQTWETAQALADENPWQKLADDISVRLTMLSRNIADFMERVSRWFADKIEPILQRIDTVRKSFGKAFSLGLNFIIDTIYKLTPLLDKVSEAIFKITQPFFDAIDPRTEQGAKAFESVRNILENLTNVAQKLVDPLSKIIDFITPIITFILEMTTSTFTSNLTFISDVFGFVIELFGQTSAQQKHGTGVIEGMVNDIKSLGQACKDAFEAVRDFFGTIFDGIRNWLRIAGKDGKVPEGGLFQRIGKFFETNKFVQDVKKKIDDAIKSIGDFIRDLPNKIADIPNVFGRLINDLFYEVDENTGEYKVEVGEDGRAKPVKTAFKRWLDQVSEAVWNFITVDIPEFVSSIPNFFGRLINDLFYEINEDTGEYKVEVGEDGKARPVKTALKEWLDSAVEAVKNFITVDIPEFVKNIPSMISTFFNSLFYTESEKTMTISGKTSKVKVRQRTALKKWLDQAVEDVKKFITKDMPAKIKSIPSIVSEFIDKLLYTEKKDKNGNVITDPKTKKPIKFFTDFHAWLDTLVNSIGDFISDFINNLPNYINTGIDAIGGFIRGIVSAIFGGGDTQDAGQEIQEELEKPFQNISLAGIIDSIKSIGRTILNNIISIFTGSTDWETNKNSLAEGVANAVSWIEEKASSAWDTAKDWFINLPNTIASFFTENSETGEPSGVSKVWTSITTFAEGIGKAILGIPDTIKKFWDNAERALGGFDQKAYDIILDQGTWSDAQHYEKTHRKSLFKFIIDKVGEGISSIVDAADEAWPKVEKWFTDLPDNISKFFNGDSNTKEPSGISKMLESIRGFGKTIGNTILELPLIIKSFWETAEKNLGNIIANSNFDQNLYDQLLRDEGYQHAEYYRNTHAENPIIKFFTQLIANVGELFKTAGPTILNGLNTALSWIGEKLGSLTEKINLGHEQGKTIDEMLAEEMKADENEKNPLWEAVKNVGKTIYDFMTNTIPDFISAAVNEISLQVPRLLGGIFGNSEEETKKVITEPTQEEIDEAIKNLNDGQMLTYQQYLHRDGKDRADKYIKDFIIPTKKAEKQAEENANSIFNIFGSLFGLTDAQADEIDNKQQNAEQATENAKGLLGGLTPILTGIKDAINAVGNSSAGKLVTVALVIGAFGYVLYNLRRILSLTDEIESVGWTAKWLGISTMMVGLTILLGYITTLAAQKPEYDKEGNKVESTLDRVLAVLNKLKDGLKEILTIVAWITGLHMAKELFSMIAEWKKADAAIKTGSKNAKMFTTRGGIMLDHLGGFLENLLGFLPAGLNSFATGFGSTTGKTLSLGLLSGFIANTAEGISDNTGDILTNLGQGLSNFGEYGTEIIGYLTSMADKLPSAIAVIQDIKKLIHNMIGLLVDAPVAGDIEIVQAYDVPEKIRKLQDMFSQIAGALAMLMNSISDNDGNLQSGVDSLSKLVNMKQAMKEFGEFVKDDSFVLFKEGLAAIGGILQLYSLTNMNTDQFNSALNDWNIPAVIALLEQVFLNDNLKKLIDAFDKDLMPEEKETLQIAERIMIFAGALSSIAKACGEITGTESESINGLIKILNEIKLEDGTESKISEIASHLGVLGNGVGTFVNEATSKGIPKDENIEAVRKVLKMIVDFAVSLTAIGSESWVVQLITGNKEMDNFGQKIQQIGGNLQSFFDKISLINFDSNGAIGAMNKEKLTMVLDAALDLARIAKVLRDANLDNFKGFGEKLEGIAESITKFLIVLSDFHDQHSDMVTADKLGFISDIVGIFSNITNAIGSVMQTNVPNGITESIDAIMDGVFGTDLDNKGLLTKMLAFINTVWSAFYSYKDKETNQTRGEEVLNFLPMLETLSSMFVSLTDSLSKMASFYADYANTMREITGIDYVNFDELDPFPWMIESLGKMIDTMIAQKDKFNDLFDMAREFDKNGLHNTLIMVSILNQLASALALFDSHNLKYGISEFEDFDWVDSLRALMTDMKLNEDEFFAPEITPKLIITEEFKQQAEALRALIDPYANAGTFDQSTYDYIQSLDDDRKRELAMTSYMEGRTTEGNYTAPQMIAVQLAQEQLETLMPTDYTDELKILHDDIEQLQTVTADLGTKMESITFTIDGLRLTEKIGPAMDRWLGTEGVFIVRANFNNGVDGR